MKLDLILLLIASPVIFILFLLFAVIGIDIVCSIFGQSKRKPNYQSQKDRQLVKDLKVHSIGDSEGDGLILFDDPFFPEEQDEE